MSISESLVFTFTIEYPFQKNIEMNDAWGDTSFQNCSEEFFEIK